MIATQKADHKLLDETLMFWEKQTKFVKNLDAGLTKIVNTMTKHGNYLEDFIVSINPKPVNIDVPSLITIVNGLRSVCDTFNMMERQVTDVLMEPTKKINMYLDSMKKPIKDAKKNEVNEMTAIQTHKIGEYLRVQTPMLFLDMFRIFNSHYLLGLNYLPNITPFQEIYNKAVAKSNSETPAPEKNIIYHQPLISILAAEGRTTKQIPKALEDIISILYVKGCYTNGIFRENSLANKEQVEKLALSISFINFEQQPPEVTAAVLKSYLRNMVESVIDNNTTQTLLETWNGAAISKFGIKEKTLGANALIHSLPAAHLSLFKGLMKLAFKITMYKDINMMDAKNLAVCLAPCIIRTATNSFETVQIVIAFLIFVIDNYPTLFPDDVDSGIYRRTQCLDFLSTSPTFLSSMNEDYPQSKGFINKTLHKKKASTSLETSPRNSAQIPPLSVAQSFSQSHQNLNLSRQTLAGTKVSPIVQELTTRKALNPVSASRAQTMKNPKSLQNSPRVQQENQIKSQKPSLPTRPKPQTPTKPVQTQQTMQDEKTTSAGSPRQNVSSLARKFAQQTN
ncbi:hypothetical protein EIN_044480 [Entamoeba invadens IP1]|uniref:Rho-GAP domain-containing protein n=1 Tax=Entamoeba invadens IP1 TaxID=370355 RepID=A0A0A1TZ77_ENTIV|nr:hypothetical protein EIN_044480 [Entamoeba invadens IP1]ELP86890.1 hypothetical protein EIN_044480 [Entamoeba invadens IP1]|eukprot:XP_004253661.1 hypothetical protein EIN_044480 [Entamoeba invadens IP1]